MAASFSRLPFKPETRHGISAASPSPASASSTALVSSPNLKFLGLRSLRPVVMCNSSTRPGGPSSGDSESRNILDAFFLGKAVAETLNERIESTVGEFLSTVGRLQAEQQKQVQEFQEEVFERAKRAKEKAARESMEAQGLLPKSTAADVTPVTDGAAASSPSLSSRKAPESNPSSNASAGSPEVSDGKSEDPDFEASTEA
ncbi:hypothetical protein CRG98_014786 [Punica granatum]|nr:hypothetical protein CRG98_014786 [Punica granatum]